MIGLAIAGGALAVQTGLALYQNYKGKKQAREDAANRPKFTIDPKVYENLNAAQQQALQGIPEEQKQQFITNTQRSQAYGLSQQGTRRGGLAGVATMNQQGIDAYGNMMSADAQARMSNQQQVFKQRQNVADYQDQQWKYNVKDPFDIGVAERQARKGALIQNIGGVAGAVAGAGIGYALGGAGKAPIDTDIDTDTGANTGGVPYGQNVGRWNDPDTSQMFVQPNPTAYRNNPNTGQWTNPNTSQMFPGNPNRGNPYGNYGNYRNPNTNIFRQ